MREDIKTEWIEALRSGKYKQTEGALENNEGNCCLGVLCNVLVDKHPEFEVVKTKKRDINDRVIFKYKDNVEPMYASLFYFLLKEVGLEFPIEEQLIRMNDTIKMDFNQIATFIEQNVK